MSARPSPGPRPASQAPARAKRRLPREGLSRFVSNFRTSAGIRARFARMPGPWKARDRSALLESQGVDGVELGCFAGRVNPENDAHETAEPHRNQDNRGLHKDRPVKAACKPGGHT